MTVTVNGRIQEFTEALSIADLLQRLALNGTGIAVALNAAVVPRTKHAHTPIHDGDVVEIIRAVAGG